MCILKQLLDKTNLFYQTKSLTDNLVYLTINNLTKQHKAHLQKLIRCDLEYYCTIFLADKYLVLIYKKLSNNVV